MKGRWNKYVWDTVLYDFHGETDTAGKPFPPDPYPSKHVFLCHESLTPRKLVDTAKGVFYLSPETQDPDVIFVHKNDWGWITKTR